MHQELMAPAPPPQPQPSSQPQHAPAAACSPQVSLSLCQLQRLRVNGDSDSDAAASFQLPAAPSPSTAPGALAAPPQLCAQTEQFGPLGCGGCDDDRAPNHPFPPSPDSCSLNYELDTDAAMSAPTPPPPPAVPHFQQLGAAMHPPATPPPDAGDAADDMDVDAPRRWSRMKPEPGSHVVVPKGVRAAFQGDMMDLASLQVDGELYLLTGSTLHVAGTCVVAGILSAQGALTLHADCIDVMGVLQCACNLTLSARHTVVSGELRADRTLTLEASFDASSDALVASSTVGMFDPALQKALGHPDAFSILATGQRGSQVAVRIQGGAGRTDRLTHLISNLRSFRCFDIQQAQPLEERPVFALGEQQLAATMDAGFVLELVPAEEAPRMVALRDRLVARLAERHMEAYVAVQASFVSAHAGGSVVQYRVEFAKQQSRHGFLAALADICAATGSALGSGVLSPSVLQTLPLE